MQTTLDSPAETATADRPGTMISRLTSRSGSWLTLVVGLVLVLGLIGGLRGATTSNGDGLAPVTSESTDVDERLASLPDHDIAPVVLVATRADGGPLTAADQRLIERLASSLPVPASQQVSPPMPSQDGKAALVQVPVRVSQSSADNSAAISSLRAAVAQAIGGSGLVVQVTGGPAFGADIAASFQGANVTLLLVTVGIVALLLLLTYRSPVLWLVPLLVVALADQLAAVVTAQLGERFGWNFDAGIVSVLVFGAGTNYALLLISRYREQLHAVDDHRLALAQAWRATAPAIAASNLTVVLALASLVFAVIPGTRGLGMAGAVGLLLAVVVVLTLLPAALAICGRGVFWPFVPRPGQVQRPGVFARLATAVTGRPGRVVLASVAVLAVLATGLVGTRVGLDQTERFRIPTESQAGLRVLAEHFPAGSAQPMIVVTDPSHVEQVAAAAGEVSGVSSAGRPQIVDATDGSQVAIVRLVSSADPGSVEARRAVEQVRDAVHAVSGAHALVGGAEATALDARTGNDRDLVVVVALVLTISALVLAGLLRSLVAVVVLLPINALSAVAAIGAGSFIGRHLFDWPALDLQVPLLSFLFLVALGIDYTIFLAHRARAEARHRPTREAMVAAVGATGAVITSAGVVLAAVFAALGVLPLVTLGQLGLIVGLGVLLDTVVVRTLLVPSLAALLGRRFWWPARLG